MKNITAKPLQIEHIEKKQIDSGSQQNDIGLNQQLIQNNFTGKEDNSEIRTETSEEGEIEQTIQRRPQFRFNENNKRRFS